MKKQKTKNERHGFVVLTRWNGGSNRNLCQVSSLDEAKGALKVLQKKDVVYQAIIAEVKEVITYK